MLILAAMVALAVSPAAGAQGTPRACEAVPARYMGMTNPTPQLDTRQVVYWSKQFKAKCANCHGEQGDGGGEDAGLQKVSPANFTDSAFMARCVDGQLFYQIMFGGEEKSAMPAFGPDSDQGWSEARIWLMAAFIRRFAG